MQRSGKLYTSAAGRNGRWRIEKALAFEFCCYIQQGWSTSSPRADEAGVASEKEGENLEPRGEHVQTSSKYLKGKHRKKKKDKLGFSKQLRKVGTQKFCEKKAPQAANSPNS